MPIELVAQSLSLLRQHNMLYAYWLVILTGERVSSR